MSEAAQPSGRNDGPEGHIFLIGFMGVGKTTVSDCLHAVTGLEEIDLDEAIERENGMTVAEIFDRFGESYFREKETAMLQKIARQEPSVVSCGGGCVLREENVSILKQSGVTVLLTAEPETIYGRIKDGTDRPLLNGHMDVAYISELMERRRESYEAAADTCIRTDGRTPEEIAGEIRTILCRKG